MQLRFPTLRGYCHSAPRFATDQNKHMIDGLNLAATEESTADHSALVAREVIDRAEGPIGVFDSGLGGLTVLRAVLAALPNENIIYLGDTARVPYGTRSADTVIRYARGCARVLTQRGVKAVVVACNTVSAVALDMLRSELGLPIIGVVEPGAEAAVHAVLRLGRPHSPNAARIGVLGTAGTVASGAYPRAVARISTRLKVVACAAPLLVPLVEEGLLDGQLPELAVERYLQPLITEQVGVIVLGCTHYPILKPVIERVAERIAGHPIVVVDGAAATASVLSEHIVTNRIAARQNSSPATVELLVTDLPGSFENVARRLLGQDLPQVKLIDLDVEGFSQAASADHDCAVSMRHD
jgi:glutamate racemase